MSDLETLQRALADFVRAGYVDAYQLLGPIHGRFTSMRRLLPALPPALAALIGLFLLSETVPAEALAPLLAPADLEALIRLGVVVQVPDGVRTPSLLLLPMLGRFAFVPAETPRGWLGGEQSALLGRVTPPHRGKALDLCTGPGASALQLAANDSRVIAVDDDAAAIRLARLNVAAAGLEDRIDVREGDLWLAAAGERFERVVVTPPTLPMPPGLAATAPSGPDGLGVVRRVLGALPRILAPGGTAHMVGVCLGDERGPHAMAGFERRARELGLGMMWTLTSRLAIAPGDKGFELLLHACARAAVVDPEAARDQLAEHLATQRAEQLYLFVLTTSREAEGVRVTSHYSEAGGFWFR